ncbi:MAG: signal peptidase I [Myxococcota bacterium]|nr:signal peptidase I [Myxococcota bacterium]
MNLKHLIRRFWYFFWFFALPIVVAWVTVDMLVRAGMIEEVEVWYVLLLFAMLAFSTYTIRAKLPFWQDPDPNSEFSRHRRRQEAAQLKKNIEKLLAKKGGKVSEKGKAEVTAALQRLAIALHDGVDKSIADAVKNLEKKTDQYLAFVRKSAAREYIESIGVAVLVAVVLRLFVVEAFKIPSESMVPTLMVGDHIFVSKYRYGLSIPLSKKRLVRFAKPDYGEVIVFLKPSREEQMGFAPNNSFFDEDHDMVGVDFIKRIAALPGDVVSMQQDIMYVNGNPIPRCHVGKQTYRTRNRFRGTWEDHEADLWIEKHGKHTYTIIEESSGPKHNFGPITVPQDQVFVLGDNRDNSRDSRSWGSVPFDNIKGRAMFIWWSNRRPYGFQWDRVGTMIMQPPELSEASQAALAKCPNMR